MRHGAIFIALCMLLMAGSTGALLYLAAGFNQVEAATVAIVVLAALAIYNVVMNQRRASARFGVQLSQLAHGNSDLARQVAELGRRLAALEKVRTPDNAHIFTDPLASEIDELGALTKQLADTVAHHRERNRRLQYLQPPRQHLCPRRLPSARRTSCWRRSARPSMPAASTSICSRS